MVSLLAAPPPICSGDSVSIVAATEGAFTNEKPMASVIIEPTIGPTYDADAASVAIQYSASAVITSPTETT